MKKVFLILIVALIVQVVLIFEVYKTDVGLEVNKQTPWLTVNFDRLEKMVIESGERSLITLQRQGDSWILPDHLGFPIDQTSLQNLTDKLSNLQVGWPIATTEQAANRFHLNSEKFERKISLYQSGQLVDSFYIGTSPGFRKVHVRKDGENNIYSVELNAHDASIKVTDWFDYDQLKVNTDEIEHIEVLGMTYTLLDGAWRSESLFEDEVINEQGLKDWLSELATIRFQQVLSSNPSKGESNLVTTVKTSDKDIEFKLVGSANNQHILKRSDFPYYFALSLEQAKSLMTIDRSQFISNKQEAVSVSDPGVSITIGEDEESVKVLQDMLNANDSN